MKSFLFKIECLTNLHVGSGEANYSVVDNEVEKDPVLGCPIIHASGVKGALRDTVKNKDQADAFFGTPETEKVKAKAGTIRVMDACMLSRPLRVRGVGRSFIQVTTPDIINHFIRQAKAFGCLPNNLTGIQEVATPNNGNNAFLATVSGIRVEDEDTGVLSIDSQQLRLLKLLLGDAFALTKSLDDFPLPVVARNKLEDKKSKNLWYEELVPHDTVFYLILRTENEDDLNLLLHYIKDGLIQFGGNATVGCGYAHMQRW